MRMQTFVLSCCLLLSAIAHAEDPPPQVGIDMKLGEYLPLDTLTFFDEEGTEVPFKQFFDKPVVLTLVYYRCPGICTPVLLEVAGAISNTPDLMPGEDYRALTVSFEPKETPDLAKQKKVNMLAEVEYREVPEDGWRFFTGTEENIKLLTESVGFHYILDANEADYIHTGTVIFLSPDGKIVRYLEGLSINPAEFKMAVIDAQKGIPRDIMQMVRKICSTYDPESRSYVLAVNRIILGVTVLFLLIVGGALLIRKSPKAELPVEAHKDEDLPETDEIETGADS